MAWEPTTSTLASQLSTPHSDPRNYHTTSKYTSSALGTPGTKTQLIIGFPLLAHWQEDCPNFSEMFSPVGPGGGLQVSSLALCCHNKETLKREGRTFREGLGFF